MGRKKDTKPSYSRRTILQRKMKLHHTAIWGSTNTKNEKGHKKTGKEAGSQGTEARALEGWKESQQIHVLVKMTSKADRCTGSKVGGAA